MLYKTLLRDRKRSGILLLAIIIVGFAVPTSFLSGRMATSQFVGEGLELASPTIELSLHPQNPITFNDTEIIKSMMKLYNDYSSIKLNESLLRDRGGVIGVLAAVHLKIVKTSIENPKTSIPINNRRGELVYYLKYTRIVMKGSTPYGIYVKPLYIIASLGGDMGFVKYVEGGPPTGGRTPVEIGVDRRFASLMNWHVGDIIEFMGSNFRISGLYTYNGGLQSLSTVYDLGVGYPVIQVSKDDLPVIISYIRKYILNLDSLELRRSLLAFTSGLFTAEEFSDIIGEFEDIVPWLPIAGSNSTLLPLTSRYGDLIRNSFPSSFLLVLYADVNPSILYRVSQESSAESIARWRNNIIRIIYNDIIYKLAGSGVGPSTPTPVGSTSIGVGGYYPIETINKYGYTYTINVSEDTSYILGLTVNPYSSPISAFTLTISLVAVFTLGWLAGRDLLGVVVSDWRPRLAVIIARGAGFRSVKYSFALMLLLLVIVGGVVGYSSSIAFFYTSLGVLGGFMSMLGNWFLMASTIAMLVLIFLILYRSSSRTIASIKPVEAMRPVIYYMAGEMGRRRRVNTLLALLAFSTLIVGLSGGPEELLSRFSGVSSYIYVILIIIIILGVLGTPIAPVAMAYLTGNFLSQLRPLYLGIARRVSWLGGTLRDMSLASSMRLSTRLSRGLTVPIISIGLAIGSGFSLPALSKLIIVSTSVFAGKGSMEYIGISSGVLSTRLELVFILLLSLVYMSLSLYVLLSSLFDIIEEEVVVMRVRGATRKHALGFSLGILSQASIYSLVVGFLSGIATWIVILSVLNLSVSMYSLGEPVGIYDLLKWSVMGVYPWLVLIIIIILSILIPVIVAYKASSTRDLARVLRESGG